MKRFILISIILVNLTAVSVLAQVGNSVDDVQELDSLNNEVISTEDEPTNIDVVLSTETQDPGTKEFFLVADITSIIDSDRVIVEWQLDNGLILGEDETKYIDKTVVAANGGTEVKKRVVAQYLGTHTAKVVVTAVKADVNYVTSDTIELEFDKNLEIVPQTEEYKKAKLVYQGTRAALYLLIVAAIGTAGYFGYKEIKKIRG